MIELILLDSSNLRSPLGNPEDILAPQELNRYELLRSDMRRREFLLGRLLLKAALTEGDDFWPGDFRMISTTLSESGKPIVAGAEFNLSHDQNAILIAVGDQVIGVDIESVQNFDDAMMRICFTKEERRKISHSPHPDCAATLLWCKKEAAAKATGAGLLSEITGARKRSLHCHGGFLNVAGLNRAYAVCSSQPILQTNISPALPRFEKVFAAFQCDNAT